MKHFFSESGIWRVTAEFVTPEGPVLISKGESVISVGENEIINEVWVASEKINRRNTYRIRFISRTEMVAESLNPDMPHLSGSFNIDRNVLFFKFRMEESTSAGYQIIHRMGSVCYTFGALYDGEDFSLSWTATLNKL